MAEKRCSSCGNAPATQTTPTGRKLCPNCYRQLAELTGASVALIDGQGPVTAVAQGIATGQYAGALEADRAYQRRLRAKLAGTTGFWNRLWVRIVG
jgi:hypothetical protein